MPIIAVYVNKLAKHRSGFAVNTTRHVIRQLKMHYKRTGMVVYCTFTAKGSTKHFRF